MNVKIGTEAAQFPEGEYINGIFVAVHPRGTEGGWPNLLRTKEGKRLHLTSRGEGTDKQSAQNWPAC